MWQFSQPRACPPAARQRWVSPPPDTAERQRAAAGCGLTALAREPLAALEANEEREGLTCLISSYRWLAASQWKDWMNKWMPFLRPEWPGTTLYLWLRILECLALQPRCHPGRPFLSTEPLCWGTQISFNGGGGIWTELSRMRRQESHTQRKSWGWVGGGEVGGEREREISSKYERLSLLGWRLAFILSRLAK